MNCKLLVSVFVVKLVAVESVPLTNFKYNYDVSSTTQRQSLVMENPKLLFGDIRVPANHKVICKHT